MGCGLALPVVFQQMWAMKPMVRVQCTMGSDLQVVRASRGFSVDQSRCRGFYLVFLLSGARSDSHALDVSGQDRAEARVMRAKAGELEAHRRAIKLHEDAAILFERFHQTDASRHARQRAECAREMLRLAQGVASFTV